MRTLFLASQSPRRRDLIHLLGYPVQALDLAVDETTVTLPDPALNVMATAVLKADAAHTLLRARPGAADGVIVAADTTVAVDGEMLGKPPDEAAARAMLRRLRDRSHQVHTGLALLDLVTGRRIQDIASVDVLMRDYTDTEIDAYVTTGDPLDKAGGYAIQHDRFQPVAALADCYAGVMGLPLCHLARALRALGVAPAGSPAIAAACQTHIAYDCPVAASILAAAGPRPGPVW